MKKNYIAPQTTTFIVNATQMVCTSLSEEGRAVDSGIKSADSKSSGDWNLWDDDDE